MDQIRSIFSDAGNVFANVNPMYIELVRNISSVFAMIALFIISYQIILLLVWGKEEEVASKLLRSMAIMGGIIVLAILIHVVTNFLQ